MPISAAGNPKIEKLFNRIIIVLLSASFYKYLIIFFTKQLIIGTVHFY